MPPIPMSMLTPNALENFKSMCEHREKALEENTRIGCKVCRPDGIIFEILERKNKPNWGIVLLIQPIIGEKRRKRWITQYSVSSWKKA